jgi:hypothetical protein
LSEFKKGKSPVILAATATRIVSRGPDGLNEPKKKRLVIMVEKAEAIIARTIGQPAQERLRDVRMLTEEFGPWLVWNDNPILDIGVQSLLRYAHQKDMTIVSGDWAAYDTTIPPWLFPYAGKVLEAWFPNNKWITSHLYSLANKVRLFTPSGVVMEGPSSMKSGSGFTNLVGGLLNIIVLLYGKHAGHYDIDAVTVQGDDFLALGQGCTPEAISESAKDFGMSANTGKELFTPGTCNYLQKAHVYGWLGGVHPTYRALNSLTGYERLKHNSGSWNGYSDVVRAIAQLENTAFHPAFEAFVKFVAEGDKFGLGVKEYPKFAQASEVLQRANGLGLDGSHQSNSVVSGNQYVPTDWAKGAVNGVLRGETMHPVGSYARFRRVYGERRTEGISLPGWAQDY